MVCVVWCADLPGDALGVQLADAGLRHIACEVAKRRVLLTEHVETRRLEGHVVRRHDVLVGRQVQTVVELPVRRNSC